ncbi:GNAT family N-acetyltransferase [Metasolibacillus fluoroglycofenilyticus]|uniref:GNAT family N-acetyltransferase n=1 Tax=Metasolibacillus fluoroglycofenilyticus TaxID=1239396 RepID=UPI000D357A85|nr:GNAT family protein [Metasolibacillus fluoroglycofenilyticus]
MYRLRELQREDIPKINKWRNNEELIRLLGAPFRFINIDVDYKWYDNYMSNRDRAVRCAIVDTENKHDILGLVSLTNIDLLNQSAIFHIMIGDANVRGKGLGHFATTKILLHAFTNMNIHRIELSVLTNNIPAIQLYEKVGFKKEGISRESIYKDGQFVDVQIMSILKYEFLNSQGVL